jgi:quinol-cytochrome oxidoreductase complex cytochrome b subunit
MAKKSHRGRENETRPSAAGVANRRPAADAIASPASPRADAPPEKKPSGFPMLLLHLHPKTVPEDELAMPRTFGLGGMALLLLLVLVGTGILLLFVYDPSPEKAYASILAIENHVPFGGFVRAIHHWAANGLVVVAFLHLLRVFYTGAFHPPRRFNWVLGLMLLLLVTASNFTGYLLPWDQLSYWAVTIGTGMLAYVPVAGGTVLNALRPGGDVGAQTLSFFFVLHIAVLPILAFLFASFHFWLVRKAGGVMLPAKPEGAARRRLVPVRPNLILREGVVALVVLAILFLVAAFFPAPLEEQANPGMSPNPAKAP